MTRPDYGLPFGSPEYLKAWDEFIQPLADFLGIEPHGIDPTVSYRHENEYVQLPVWFVELFNEKFEGVLEAVRTLAQDIEEVS